MTTLDESKESNISKTSRVDVIHQGKKYPIICKFWMMGTCNKDDKCDYLHNEQNKNSYSAYNNKLYSGYQPESECPMFKLGFCKNGSMCSLIHIREIKSDSELESHDLPQWYLEYIFEKPLNVIFEEYQEQFKEEFSILNQKYSKNLKKFQKNFFGRTQHIQNNIYKNYQFDIYAEKKDSILTSLNKKVRYFFIRNETMDYVQFAMENNLLLTSKHNSIKFLEAQKSCDEVVFIFFDEENLNFNGFSKLKKELEEKEVNSLCNNYMSSKNKNLLEKFQFSTGTTTSYINIEWYWKTKLSFNKVELLRNPLNDNELFINSKDGQEVSIDLGSYICRFMIKRLSKEEVQEYLDYKKSLSGEKINFTGNNTKNQFKNLDSIIYDEIKKNNGNIIVTNISNLQVNISQNSFTSREKKRSLTRSRSISRKRSKKSKKYRNRGDKDDRYLMKSKKSSRKSSDSDSTVVIGNNCDHIDLIDDINDNSNVHVHDVVTISPDLSDLSPSNNKLSKFIRNAESDLHDQENKITPNRNMSQNEHKFTENKIVKNKLFSNAMEKIALNYIKKGSKSGIK